jgi:hypothetical protein
LLQILIDDRHDLTSETDKTAQLGLLNFYNTVGEHEIAKQLAKK